MKVHELVPSIEKMNIQFHPMKLGDIDFGILNGRPEIKWITIDTDPYTLSENNHFLRYLKVSPTTYQNLPNQMRTQLVNYLLLQKWPDDEVELISQGGEIVDIHPTSAKYITIKELASTISSCFDPEDEIVKFSLDRGFKCYVTDAQYQLEVRDGDYTYGGIYFRVLPNEAPVSIPFLMREVGRLGMTLDESSETASYRGRTVPDVLAEIKVNAQYLLRNIPSNLQGYRTLTEMEIDGDDMEQWVHRLCQEHEVAASIESAGLDRVATIPRPKREVAVYDVLNEVLNLMNESGVRETQVEKLQSLGGSVVRDSGSTPRCHSCQHRLI